MSIIPTRRRFLKICASATILPTVAIAAKAPLRWHGIALGANASIVLYDQEEEAARVLFSDVEAEVARLERIFSLYRKDSVLTRLNRKGSVRNPPPEMLEVLSLSAALHDATSGAFDPTIQSLWTLYASAARSGRRPTSEEIASRIARTGLSQVAADTTEIRFERPEMAMTFNGIAQGFIADRVSALLRRRGLSNLLVDMGEIAGLGQRPDHTPWRVGVEDPDGNQLDTVLLRDRCLATSSPGGTRFSQDDPAGHILDPRSGKPAARWRVVTVTADRAALADGLSTAFCLMSRREIADALERFPSGKLETLV